MTPLARALVGVGALAVAVAVAGLVVAGAAGARSGDPGVLGPGAATVELSIEHSVFDTASIQVHEGTEVTFVVANGDPIRHELIVGPADEHRRHEDGTEAAHPPRPGEVTVEPLASATTTYRFDEPGFVVFACHLPGHLAYGMAGVVEVLPA
jgi:uncharacterized cupredoxin-like copper-binding protein